MAAEVWNIVAEQGASFNPVVIWTDNNGAPVSLTGYTVKMQVRDTPGGTLLTDLSSYIILGGAAGTISFNVLGSVTDGWTFVNGVHDLKLTSPANLTTRLLKGSFKVDPEVTL